MINSYMVCIIIRISLKGFNRFSCFCLTIFHNLCKGVVKGKGVNEWDNKIIC